MKDVPRETRPPRFVIDDVVLPEGCTTGILCISVGGDLHEKQQFMATATWAARRFRKVVVEIADTLQRHNYVADGMPEAEARAFTFRRGSLWIDRNRKALIEIAQNSGVEVTRWDQWIGTLEFAEAKEKIWTLYSDEPEFRRIIDASVRPEKRDASLCYLLEETAAMGLIADAYPNSVMLYPGAFLDEAWPFFRERPHLATRGLADVRFRRLNIRPNPALEDWEERARVSA